jgi:hypothetical protein
MSQYGMNMPGGVVQRRASMDVYTGLLFVAMICLAAASVFLWMQGAKIGPEGNALNLHSGAVKLPTPATR